MAYENIIKTNALPLVPIKDIVLFPDTLANFEIAGKTGDDVAGFLTKDSVLFFSAQKDPKKKNPGKEDIYAVGTIGIIRQTLKLSENKVKVFVQGISRGVIEHFEDSAQPPMVAIREYAPDAPDSGDEQLIALIRTVKDAFRQYAGLVGRLPQRLVLDTLAEEDPDGLTNLIGGYTDIRRQYKQEMLEEFNSSKRLLLTLKYLYIEIDLLLLQQEILRKAKAGIDQAQREYYLKEQLKIIQEELGDKDGIQAEIEEYRQKIAAKNMPAFASERLEKEFTRLLKASGASAEAVVIRDYIDLALSLPWSEGSEESGDLAKAAAILNKNHYGLDKVKERILEFLTVRKVADKADVPILCLVGPPGVGKTSIAASVAAALNRKYIRISLGGVRDESEIRGHRKTYVGAMPGRIISALKTAGVNNPLILFDEIDKLGADFRGDPSAALLEVLDAEQNKAFRDNYLEMPFDLSGALFICTANVMDTAPPALRDRLEIIDISSYTTEEKVHIAARHLIPKQLKKNGLNREQLKISKNAVYEMIHGYTREAGVRQLERLIGKLCRKAVKRVYFGETDTVRVGAQNLKAFLGSAKFKKDILYNDGDAMTNPIGIVNGLAWTAVGGAILSVEASVMNGSGKLELTGKMGDVMKESARAAISYIRSKSDELKIPPDFYKTTDIHIHIPEGAVPKDGPSAGITMAAAMISALTARPMRSDIGMTGEITISGRVLAIGGLKEKMMAAKNAGVKKVILPTENKGDYEDLPAYITDGMEVLMVSHMSEVLGGVFAPLIE